MNAHTPILTPLALQNADVLRALADHVFGVSTSKVWTSTKALAEHLGRDDSNLGKSLRALHEAGLIYQPASWNGLTDLGQTVLAALNRAEGIGLPPAAAPDAGNAAGVLVAHERIIPDGLNPRKHFDEAEVAELADSIARDDLLENLVIRPAETDAQGGGPFHRLVAGERRWRAIKLLIADGRWPKDKAIPCKVVNIDDAAHRRIALVENLQRKDLRPIDEAKALKDLMELTGAGTAEIAKDIGFTQRFVQQRLQLLELPAVQQIALNEGKLTIEEARQTLARRPKPLDLTAWEALILFEVAWAVAATKDARSWTDAPCDFEHEGAPADAETRGLLYFQDWGENHKVRVGNLGHQHLRAVTADQPFDRTHLEAHVRAARIAVLDASLSGAEKAAIIDGAFKAKTFFCHWLNPPFRLPPEVAEERARRRAEDAERRERSQAEHAERQRMHEAQAAALSKALPAARDLAVKFDVPDRDQQLDALAKAAGHPLPWRWQNETEDESGGVIDADGQFIEFESYSNMAGSEILQLLVLGAVNNAAGHPTEFYTPASESDDVEDEA